MEARMEIAGGLPVAALSTVIHVGASRCTAQAYFGTSADRIVLVEGDADTFAELRRVPLGARSSRIDLIHCVVAAETGPVRWFRYSIPRFNGPRREETWLSRYPRLRVLDSKPVEGRSLSDLVRQLLLSRKPDTSNVLMLDVPGQERRILCNTQPDILSLFDWLAIRADGATRALAGPSAGEQHLISMHFQVHGALDANDPWPLVWYRLDRRRYELHLALGRAAAAEARAARLHDELERLAAAHAPVLARSRELDAMVQTYVQSQVELRAELQRKQSALDLQRDNLLALEAQAHHAKLDNAEKAALLRERDSQLQASCVLVNQMQSALDAQRDNLLALEARVHRAQLDNAEKVALLHERDSQLQAHYLLAAQWQQQRAELERRLDRQRNAIAKAQLHLELLEDLVRVRQRP